LVALLALAGCSASRSDELGSECITNRECGSGSVCESGHCTSTEAAGDGANITGKVAGAPSGVAIDSKASGDEVCEQRDGKGLVCALSPGDKLTLIAPVVEGYRFKGWTGKDGCTSSEPTLKLSKVQRSTTCTANYVKRVVVTGTVEGTVEGEASVIASSNSAFASCEGASCEVDVGGTVVLAAPERDGFRIAGFEGEGCAARTGYRVTVSDAESDVTCTASYVDSLTVRGQIQGVAPEVLRALPVQIVASSPAQGALCEGQVCAIDSGNSVTLTAPLIDKYRFRGWTGDTPCLGTELAIQLDDVTTNVLCTADYVARFDVSGESEGAAASISATSENLFSGCDGAHCDVDSGESVTLHAGTVDGYRLKNWTGAGCEPLSGASAIARDVTSDVVCTAHYVEGVSVTGTVINAEGDVDASSDTPGADCGRGSCAIDVGGSVTLTAPSLPGRTFLGWTGDPGCTSNTPSVTLDDVTTSKSCNATFAARYTVTTRAVPVAGGQVTATSGSRNAACSGPRCEVDEGSTVTLNATANPDFRFTGWSGGGPCMGSAPRLDLSAVKASVTCSATFVARIKVGGAVTPANTGTVTARQLSLSAQCAGPVCTVDAGTDVVLTATASTGYEFSRWTGCGSSFNPLLGSNPLPVIGPTSDTTCTATFVKKTYLVSAVAGSGGTVAASTGFGGCPNAVCTVEHGGSAVLTATPSSGYDFAGWSGCSISTAGTVGNVTMPQTCTASFTKIKYVVTAVAGPGGQVTASTGGAQCASARCNVDENGSVQLTATAAVGYDFASWTGCSVSAGGTVTGVRTALTCTANFSKERYSLTGESTGVAVDIRATSTSPGNQCSGKTCTVDYGTNVTLTVPATDPQGFRFDGWQACTGARVSGRSLTVDSLTSSYTCRASYTALRRLTVTVASSGPGTAACSGSCTVYEGESVTITATRRDSASAFDGWTCSDGRALGKTTPASVDNLQQNITCTANFSDIPLL
jgi:hypothetical protein